MLFISLIRWWYSLGWFDQARLVRVRLSRVADFFSIGLSVRSLFKPFKQIDADNGRKGSLDMMMRAAFDGMFSRFIGFMVRSVLIFIGCLALVIEAFVGGVRLLLWPLLPALPVLVLPLAVGGWTP